MDKHKRELLDMKTVRVTSDQHTGEKTIEVEPISKPKSTKRLYELDAGPPEALVIHCGDPRFQRAFRDFITQELGIRRYIPIVVGGGVHALAVQSFLPKNFKILWEQIKFFIRQTNQRQIILINHEDCLWYKKMQGYHPGVDLPVKGKLDLGTASSLLLKDFAGVSVRTFWAGLEDGKVSFTETTHD